MAMALLAPAVLAAGALAAEGGAQRKSLADCIELALRQQPTLKASNALVDAARERVWETASAYLPQVSAGGSATRRKANAGSLTSSNQGGTAHTFNFYTAGFSFSQILFDFGQNLERIHAAQARQQSSAADADTQRDTVVFNVEQAYFALLANQRLLDVANETVVQNRQHLDLAKGRFDVGQAAKIDVTTAEVQLAQAELNQVTARNNVTLGRETLRNAIGLSGPLDFEIVDLLHPAPVTIDDAEVLTIAYDNRPELRSLRAQEEAARQDIAALEKDYLPKATANGSYAWSGSSSPLLDTWSLGAGMNVSLFNGGLTTASIGEARATLQNLQWTEEATRQNVTLDVRQATLNVHTADEAIRVADKGLEQAHENLDLAEGRYQTGVGSIIELTDAQTSLVSSKVSLVQALVNYRTALAALERATAHPFARD
jgi:outer membrane protein